LQEIAVSARVVYKFLDLSLLKTKHPISTSSLRFKIKPLPPACTFTDCWQLNGREHSAADASNFFRAAQESAAAFCPVLLPRLGAGALKTRSALGGKVL